jgi:hypothetical protein
MTTCDVLRCQGPRDKVFVLLDEPLLEAAVCQTHHERLIAGDRWMMGDGEKILMNADLPPKVVEYVLGDQPGSDKGVSLKLELETPTGPRSQTLWLSTDNADKLGTLLSTRITGR